MIALIGYTECSKIQSFDPPTGHSWLCACRLFLCACSNIRLTRITCILKVHLVPADHLALSDLAKHQQQTRANGTFTAKPFCAPVLSTKAELSGMR